MARRRSYPSVRVEVVFDGKKLETSGLVEVVEYSTAELQPLVPRAPGDLGIVLANVKENVPCPNCAGMYHPRGLPTHKKSLRCRVDTARRIKGEAGFLPLEPSDQRSIHEIEAIVRESGVKWHRDLAAYVPGGPNQESLARNGCYVPRELHPFFLELLSWSTVVVPVSLAVPLARHLLGDSDGEFRRAFLALSGLLKHERGKMEVIFPATSGAQVAAQARCHEALADLAKRWGG